MVRWLCTLVLCFGNVESLGCWTYWRSPKAGYHSFKLDVWPACILWVCCELTARICVQVASTFSWTWCWAHRVFSWHALSTVIWHQGSYQDTSLYWHMELACHWWRLDVYSKEYSNFLAGNLTAPGFYAEFSEVGISYLDLYGSRCERRCQSSICPCQVKHSVLYSYLRSHGLIPETDLKNSVSDILIFLHIAILVFSFHIHGKLCFLYSLF
jgi:hypothetical protein